MGRAWCAREPACRASLANGRLTGPDWSSGSTFFIQNMTGDDDLKYPLFGLPILPSWAATLTELVIHFSLALEIACHVGAQACFASMSVIHAWPCWRQSPLVLPAEYGG